MSRDSDYASIVEQFSSAPLPAPEAGPHDILEWLLGEVDDAVFAAEEAYAHAPALAFRDLTDGVRIEVMTHLLGRLYESGRPVATASDVAALLLPPDAAAIVLRAGRPPLPPPWATHSEVAVFTVRRSRRAIREAQSLFSREKGGYEAAWVVGLLALLAVSWELFVASDHARAMDEFVEARAARLGGRSIDRGGGL